MGRRAVGTDAEDGDVDAVGRRSDEARVHGKLARRVACGDVKGQREVGHAEALVESVLEHRLGAADAFLRRLAHEHDGSVPAISRCRESSGRADHRGHVGVVPTGVHHGNLLPGDVDLTRCRLVLQSRVLENRKTVHVGPDQNHRTVAIAQNADDASPTDLLGDLDVTLAELVCQSSGGLFLSKGKLGVLVEVQEKCAELVVIVVEDRLAKRGLRGDDRNAKQRRGNEQDN